MLMFVSDNWKTLEGKLNIEMIRKIWRRKSKSNSDKIWTIWKKGMLKSEKI